jgi:hypothetical protein
VKIVKQILPKATLTDFLRCGRFHGPPLSFFLVLFLSLSLRSRFVEKISLQDRLCATMGHEADSQADLVLLFGSSRHPQAGRRFS